MAVIQWMLQKFPHTLHLIKSTKWNKSKLCNMLSKGGSISNDYCCFLFIVQQCPSNKVANGVQFMQLIIICKPHNCQHKHHSILEWMCISWKNESMKSKSLNHQTEQSIKQKYWEIFVACDSHLLLYIFLRSATCLSD